MLDTSETVRDIGIHITRSHVNKMFTHGYHVFSM